MENPKSKCIVLRRRSCFSIALVLAVLAIPSLLTAQAEVCRTPGGKRALLFAPCAYALHSIFPVCDSVARWQGYQVTSYIQATNPGTRPTVTLQDFIDELEDTDIGILFLDSHGNRYSVALEFYEYTQSGREARDLAFYMYTHRLNDPIDSTLIVMTETRGVAHSISLNIAGVQHYNSHLDKAIVYVETCYSAGLNQYWNSLCVLGFDGRGAGLGNRGLFFPRMAGLPDRGPDTTDLRREIGDAAEGLYCLSDEGDTVRLVLTRNSNQDKVVLSPIVLNHWPRSMDWFEPGTWGWVHFDCIMDTTVNPKTVVRTTGVDVAISEAEWWTPHGIKFLIPDIPDLQQHCFVGFQVDPNLARSKHNHSMLDGNTNPGRRNGVSPNGDFYNWTCACDSEVLDGYMDFEEGVDARPIPDTLGWRFLPGQEDVWRYGDKRTGNYSIYPWSDYYWCDGNFFAGIPFTDAFAVELTGATARSVCLGASSNSEWLYLTALDSTLTTVVDKDSMPANTKTYSLSLLTVRAERIGRITIYGDRNSFLVDNLTVFDICGDATGLITEQYEPVIRDIEILQLNDELHFPFPVAEYAESLQVAVNCLPQDMPQGGIGVALYNSADSLVLDKEIKAPPFLSDPVPNPVVGEWDIAVRALQSQEGTCPIAAVAATRNAPRVDCLIQDSVEVWWYPSIPKYGETITIFSKIHCNDELEYSLGIEYMPVRCSLNSPTGEKIDNDDFAANLVPGGVDTVMFSFDTHTCTQPSHCRVYISIDPDNQIAEYSELNNITSKQIIFAP